MTEQNSAPQQDQQDRHAPAIPQSLQQPQGASGLAITGLVLGVLAVVLSFIPIVNNAAFVFAIIGLILAIAGRSQVKKGTKSGGGIAVAGIVLCIVALVVTLAVQAACSAALDSITSGESGTVAGESGAQKADTSNMAIGQTVDLDSGLSVTINSVTPGLENFDGSLVTAVSVTYTNNGTDNASFNTYDWKAEDANGAQRTETYYSEAGDELSAGTLSPGGTVTGNVFFDEPVAKIYYYSSIIDSDSNIAWIVA